MDGDREDLMAITHFCDRVMSYTEAVSKQEFLDSMILRDACATNCIAIGYRVERLSDSLKAEYDGMDWKSLRNSAEEIEHLYGTPAYDDEALWNLVSGIVPKVRDYCRTILDDMKNQ